MPTEARGNYLPEAPYLCETKCYLNRYNRPMSAVVFMHASESTLDSGTSGTASHSSRHDSYFVPISIYGPFLLLAAEVMSKYLTTDGLKKFSLLLEAP